MPSAITPDEWEALRSGSTESRLRAARTVLQDADVSDADAVRKLSLGERDELVRSVLRRAYLRLISRQHAGTAADASAPQGAGREAAHDLAGDILHELAPLVGRLKDAASDEIESYAYSETKRIADSLDRLLVSIDTMRAASSAATGSEIDVTALVEHVARDVADERDRIECVPSVSIDLARADHFVVQADPGLLSLALSNGLRNATEACAEIVNESNPCRVVVSWGITDKDCWISVIDDGPGPPRATGDVFETGQTTKRGTGHMGHGLAIAKRAMEGLGGTVRLMPRDPRGARYELRWPRG